MAYTPDVCYHDAQYELVSEKGAVKYVAFFQFGYYCRRRNRDTGLCTTKLETTAADTGIPYSNVSQNRTFLDDIGWIHVYKSGTIRPLKGFYTDEQIFFTRVRKLIARPFFVQLIRILFLQNRKGILIVRNLFKGTLNQHIEPALLTSEGTRAAKRRSVPHTSPDKIFKNQSAGKSAPRSSADEPTNAAPTRKPTDERRFHPAIQMVKEITGRFPKKEFWDRIIREIGSEPNTEFFKKSFERWRGVRGHFETYEKWLYQPNKTGKIPEIWGEKFNGNGSGKPPDVPKNPITTATEKRDPIEFDERVLKAHLQYLQSEGLSDEDLNSLEENYTPKSWAWLRENLKDE